MIINTSILLGMAEFAPTKDLRDWLNGVIFDFSQPNNPTLVATDGNTLVAYCALKGEDEDLTCVPSQLLTRADLQGLPAGKDVSLTFTSTQVDITSQNFSRSIKWTGTVIAPPNWRRLFGQSEPGPSTLACAPLEKFAKFAKRNKTDAIVMTAGPHTPSVIRFDRREDLIGLIMPRNDTVNTDPPDWV